MVPDGWTNGRRQNYIHDIPPTSLGVGGCNNILKHMQQMSALKDDSFS